jgi:hypothetical protein
VSILRLKLHARAYIPTHCGAAAGLSAASLAVCCSPSHRSASREHCTLALSSKIPTLSSSSTRCHPTAIPCSIISISVPPSSLSWVSSETTPNPSHTNSHTDTPVSPVKNLAGRSEEEGSLISLSYLFLIAVILVTN